MAREDTTSRYAKEALCLGRKHCQHTAQKYIYIDGIPDPEIGGS